MSCRSCASAYRVDYTPFPKPGECYMCDALTAKPEVNPMKDFATLMSEVEPEDMGATLLVLKHAVEELRPHWQVTLTTHPVQGVVLSRVKDDGRKVWTRQWDTVLGQQDRHHLHCLSFGYWADDEATKDVYDYAGAAWHNLNAESHIMYMPELGSRKLVQVMDAPLRTKLLLEWNSGLFQVFCDFLED